MLDDSIDDQPVVRGKTYTEADLKRAKSKVSDFRATNPEEVGVMTEKDFLEFLEAMFNQNGTY